MKLLRESADFGRLLIETRDLDPVYVALNGSGLALPVLERWCVAYWLYYSSGVASVAATFEGQAFWAHLLGIVSRAPRGMERRHFRGVQAVDAMVWLGKHFDGPEAFVAWLFAPHPEGKDLDLGTVRARAKVIPMFGPWISWKLADMGERCLGRPVSFDNGEIGIYKDPRQGAALVDNGDWKSSISDDNVRKVTVALIELLGDLRAPPQDDRPLNAQEIETVLCKFKANRKGFYPLGKDSRDVAESLEKAGGVAPALLTALRARCSEAR